MIEVLHPDVRLLIIGRRWARNGKARMLLAQAGLNDPDVAEEVDVRPRTLTAWLDGAQVPRRGHAIALGGFLVALATELGEPVEAT